MLIIDLLGRSHYEAIAAWRSTERDKQTRWREGKTATEATRTPHNIDDNGCRALQPVIVLG